MTLDEVNNWWNNLPDSRKKAVVGIYLRKPNGYFKNITQDEKNKLYQKLNVLSMARCITKLNK